MADKVINVDIKTNTEGVKSLKQELRETVEQLQRMPSGTKEFEAMTLKAAELKDKMADVNEQINVFASGSKYEQVSNSLGEIGNALVNLDFEKAQDRAGAFAKAASSISFSDAIQSVKQLGSTFMTIGKALLTNPLFLIAAVIIAIVAAVVKLLDKLGVLKKIMEAIDKVIGLVVDSFKELLDWIGLTDFAGEKFAENQIKRNEEIIESEAKKTNEIVGALDFEIKKRQANGEDTAELEKERLRVIRDAAKEELKTRLQLAAATALLYEKDSEEFKKAMANVEAAKESFKQAAQEVEIAEIKFNARRREEWKKASDQRKSDIEQAAREEAKMLEDLRLLRLHQEQDLYAQIEALENEYYTSKLNREDQEIQAAREKYFAIIEAAREAGMETAILEEAQQAVIQEIEDRYRDERLEKDKAAIEELDAIKLASEEEDRRQAQETADVKKQLAMDVMSASIGFISSLAQISKNLSAGETKDKEKEAKKQFKIDKGVALVTAAINTALSITKYAGNIPMMALAAATGALSIAAIASKQYQGGASNSGGSSSIPSVSAMQPQQDAAPSFNMFGSGGNANQLSANESIESNITVNAVVSESEVTGTQQKVMRMNKNAEL